VSEVTTDITLTDRFVIFDCEGEACVGILTVPPTNYTDPKVGVLVIVGGPQYRVGSHRQFVLLCRALARAGIPVLRFDYRGMGDSEGEVRTFETIDKDIAAAVDALQRETGVKHVVLWGLCDGASAALIYGPDDSRVAGIVALNPWVRLAQGSDAWARLKHYYLRRLMSSTFWSKLLTGKLELQGSRKDLMEAFRGGNSNSPTTSPYLQRMQESWGRFAKPLLFILSGNDFTAREFEEWINRDHERSGLLHRAFNEIATVADADHTFSRREWRAVVAEKTAHWVHRVGRQPIDQSSCDH
jgi:uncharacterized protein